MKRSNLVEELRAYKLKKIPNFMLFALVLRNTYISSYKTLVENFPFPSLLLEKISSGATDTVKCQQNAGKKYLRQHACENILLEIPCFSFVNFPKNYFSIASLSEDSTEFSFHIARYVAEKIKKHLSCCCHGLLVVDSVTSWSPDFRYMKIWRRRGLTTQFLDFANYPCINFAI